MVLRCPEGMLPTLGEQRANSGGGWSSLSTLLKQGNGTIHLFLCSKQIDHDSVGRLGRVKLLVELGSQQSGPADAVGRALGITLSHGIFGFRLKLQELAFSIRCPGRVRRNSNNEQEER